MKKVVITQSNYIPWKGYFDAMNIADEFILYDDMQYTKRDWRNRNKIKTTQGSTWLSIPVEVKGNFNQKIKETRISDHKWSEKHWKTIQHAYVRAPYWKENELFFKNLYAEAGKLELLSEVNHLFLSEIAKLIGIKTRMRFSDEFELKGDKTEKLVNICAEVNATDYYTGPAAKAYMDQELFRMKNISVHFLDYSNYAEYTQLHPPFEHGVSILDLIFNTGPRVKEYLIQKNS